MHGAAQLRINADLDKKAKLWAKKMAAEDRESLDVNSQYGQLTFSGIRQSSCFEKGILMKLFGNSPHRLIYLLELLIEKSF